MDKKPCAKQRRREKLFLLLTAVVAAVCVLLAFGFAVPLRSQQVDTLPDMTALEEYLLVDLNTADAKVLSSLPGVGEKKADAIIRYREENGPFAAVQDVLNVSGITQSIVDSWNGMAQVCS